MKIMTRKEAIASNLKRYFTGKPCPFGHVSERRITGACGDCARIAKRAWNQVNTDAQKASKAASQKRNRESANERNRRYAATHREQLGAKAAAWSAANPGRRAAIRMGYIAARMQRTPAWADLDAIAGMFELCAIFRSVGLDLHVDHVVPLQGKKVSGLHVPENLQLLHSSSNRSKLNHFAVS